MTIPPKDKAKELFDKMKGFRVKHSHSLKCAKIAVDEIINSVTMIEEDVYEFAAYWIDVRKELDNLKT